MLEWASRQKRFPSAGQVQIYLDMNRDLLTGLPMPTKSQVRGFIDKHKKFHKTITKSQIPRKEVHVNYEKQVKEEPRNEFDKGPKRITFNNGVSFIALSIFNTILKSNLNGNRSIVLIIENLLKI
jgi:hypothetical protein